MQEFTVQLFDDGSAQISGTGANLELRFGYSKNAHMYSVKFIRSEEWEDLYIRVHFHPEADIYDVEPVLAQNNIVDIPAMVTSMSGEGKLTIEGTDGYKTITSADIPYRVSENSGIDSDTDPEPGESSFQQFVDAVKKDAESATQAAKDAGDILKETKKAGASALTDIETAKDNAISEIEKIESEVKGEIQEDVDSAKSSAVAAAKSAEEAKTAADSAKKSLSDLETAKQSAISEISKEKDLAASAVGSAKEAALNEISTSSNSAVKSVKTAETNAINAVKTEGSTQKTALNNASSAALTSIETAKKNALKAVEDKAGEESLAIDEKASQVIGSVQNAGDAELLAISQATNSSIEQITQSADQHLTQIDSAADEAVRDILNAKEDSLLELEAVNAHPPIQNSETGKWQVWNSETASYVDTEYDWEGGYYSPSVDSEGNLTWESSKEGMEDIPSSNIRGPQGLGVPTPTANDDGKAPTVNAAGTGYELTGPYAPLSAAIIETAKGNPAVCEDGVEWPLQGMRAYGKSTQVSTTGANLIDVVEFETSYYNTKLDSEEYSAIYDQLAKLKLDTQYRVSSYNYENFQLLIEYDDTDSSLFYIRKNNQTGSAKNAPIKNIHFYGGPNDNSYRIIKKIMLNEGSTPLPYEPYTGGKPSPSPEYPQEIHSAGDDGEIDVSLTGAQKISFPLWNESVTKNGVTLTPTDSGFKVSGTASETVDFVSDNSFSLEESDYILSSSGVRNDTVDRMCVYAETGEPYCDIIESDNVSGVSHISEGSYYILYRVLVGQTVNKEYSHIMLNAGSTALPFEPYKTPQSLTFQTPNGLPGIPVDSGGTFVDSTGQEWVCNYRDYDAEKDIKTIEYIANYNKESVGDIWMSTTGQLTVGASVLYALDTPIQSSIPADELAAYRALHAYDGTTVITPDDALAEVEADYIVRPKAYIEKKLTAIESRLNALEISEALEGE